jgi:hypothetical protein
MKMESLKEISLSSIEKNGDAKLYSYNLINDEAKKLQEQTKLNQSKNSMLFKSNFRFIVNLFSLFIDQNETSEPNQQIDNNALASPLSPDEEAIEQMWDSIEQDIERSWQNYFQPNKTIALSKHSKIPKCIRVFVSSTFTDFYNEREALVKKVSIHFSLIMKIEIFCS